MSTLFSPIQIGPVPLKHRVVMALLTRSRAEQSEDYSGELMLHYYAQRASDGGLIISEGASISPSARGWPGVPGLYSEAQVSGWKKITDAVHAKGGRIFAQLCHAGRSTHLLNTGGSVPVSASSIPNYWRHPLISTHPQAGWTQPSPHRALEICEIEGVVDDYRRASLKAKEAGFDGIELNAANGYLPDQFLQNGSNKRTDAYGGSIENRARFLLEVSDAIASVYGADRLAVRIGSDGKANGMSDSDSRALFQSVAEKLNRFALAYLHLIEPRIRGDVIGREPGSPITLDSLRKVYRGTIIAAGGFEPDTAAAVINGGSADLVAFGRYAASNPDLPSRIKRAQPLGEC